MLIMMGKDMDSTNEGMGLMPILFSCIGCTKIPYTEEFRIASSSIGVR